MKVNRKLGYGLLLFLTILSLVLGAVIYFSVRNENLKVIFLDVGQGDAILVTQGNNQLLVDGGKSGKVLLEKVGRHIPFWDRRIEVVVATHPDQDHIGGLIDVLKNYQVDTVIKTGAQSASQTFKAFSREIEHNSNELEAKRNMSLKIGDDTRAEIIYPFYSQGDNAKKSNDGSIVIRLTWKDESFLLTGDLPTTGEQDLIDNDIDLRANILKVAHHGSKNSTSEEFLEEVGATEAIISVGEKNRYNHPNKETMERLRSAKMVIFETSKEGDIIYNCQVAENDCLIED